MKRVRDKLKSTRGASLLFALVVFMLCMFAGVAALVAASSNAGRFAHAEKDQQQYLSVGSAVELFKDELGTTELKFSREFVETQKWHYEVNEEEDTTTLVDDPTAYQLEATVEPENKDSLLYKLIGQQCKELFEAKYVPSDWYSKLEDADVPALPGTVTKTLNIGAVNDNFTDVHADMEMDPGNCTIFITLRAGEADGSTYKATIQLPFKVTQNITTEAETSGDGDNGQTQLTSVIEVTMEWPADGIMITKDLGGQASASTIS